jgi:hypothetical protein
VQRGTITYRESSLETTVAAGEQQKLHIMRGVEKLEVVQDEKVKQDDLEYLERTNMKEFLQLAMAGLLKAKPADPISFLIDYIKNGPQCPVAPEPALKRQERRKSKLQAVYKKMDKV